MSKMFVVAALAVAFCAIPSTGRTQEAGDDAEVTKMAKEHYRAGLEAYKNGQYDVAIKELKRAYLLKRLPALLLNIGATYRKMGDLDLALHFYKKYLDEAPPEARDRGDVENTVKEIEAEKGGGGSKEATPPETPPSTEQPSTEGSKEESPAPRKRAAMPSEWSHTVVDAAPPNVPLDVRVSMPVMKGVKVYVFYRASGESDFQQVLMKRRGAEKIGRIPGDAMNGNAMQYYIEARDGAGQVVKNSGSQTSPNIVMIDPNAPPQTVASLDSSRDREHGGEAVAPEPAEEKAGSGHDDEEAPLLVEGKKAKRDRERRSSGGGGGGAHLLRWVGVGLLAGGAVIAAGVGTAMFYEAKVQSDAVTQDSKNGGFLFNDPTVHNTTGDDSSFQSKGKLYNTVGIAMTAVGSAVAVAGLALVVVDVVRGSGGGGSEKSKKPKHPREEESSFWYVAPTVSQTQVGVGGGFSF
jgi:hypothetical protein